MNYFEQFRLRREKVYESLFSANVLFITGLFVIPAILFNPSPVLRAAQFLFFWFLCWLAGKKNKVLISIFVFLTIVTFNLLVPYGRVLYSIGTFTISYGALMTGINRAATLQGLIMLSRLTIRRDLKIPGSFGELIGESFQVLSKIIDSKLKITRKNFITDIDRLLIRLSEDEKVQEIQSNAAAKDGSLTAGGTKPMGFIIISFVVILSWLPLFFLVFS